MGDLHSVMPGSLPNQSLACAVPLGSAGNRVSCAGSTRFRVMKLLSEDPSNYRDAPTEAIRSVAPVLAWTPWFPQVAHIISHTCRLSDAPLPLPPPPIPAGTLDRSRVVSEETGVDLPKDQPIDSSRIGWIRMGTTVATNALLERAGEPVAFVTSKGLRDILHIGNQSRPKIFDLEINRPELL